MKLQIFDVAHGACALLTGPNNERVMIDCGNNPKTGWEPGGYLCSEDVKKLEVLAITNYDEDHVRGIASVFDNIQVSRIFRNRSVSPDKIRALKTKDGMGTGIERLVKELEPKSMIDDLWFGPSIPSLRIKPFWNKYPKFEDENNLSLALHLKCRGVGVLFPGDLEKAGWLELLKRVDFKQALSETDILIASHHGREDGCCEEIFEYCQPQFIVISDKSYMYNTQDTVYFYRRFASGGKFRGENRRVLTTRKDGEISFSFPEDIKPATKRTLVWIG